MVNADFFENFVKDYAGTGHSGYLCSKCKAELERIMVKTTVEQPKKLFFCLNYNKDYSFTAMYFTVGVYSGIMSSILLV